MVIQGTVSRVKFAKEDFFIFDLAHGKAGMDKITIKGNFSTVVPREGVTLKVTGKEHVDPKWGRQMKADYAEEVITTRHGAAAYLQTYVQGIGEVTANRLAERFGTDLVDVLNERPEVLDECDFLNDAQRANIRSEWAKNAAVRDANVFLLQHGLGPQMAQRVITMWGPTTQKVLTENPYRLTEVPRIGFKLADRFALSMGVPADSVQRVRACINYILMEVLPQRGHLFAGRPELYEAVLEVVPVPAGRIDQALQEMINDAQVILDGEDYYPYPTYQIEVQSAAMLAERLNPIDRGIDVDEFVREFEQLNGIGLSDHQKEALRILNRSQAMVLTGLPGTGKTTVTKAIVALFERQGIRYHLLAPTGVSAQRMSEATGRPAHTIHRLLGYSGAEWKYNGNNQFHTQAVIIDEMSMVDMQVFYRIMDAVPATASLVFVGDTDQLPSVGAGNVLKELIRCGRVPSIKLTEIFRQSMDSGIVVNAHLVNAGEMIDHNARFKDFTWVVKKDEQAIFDEMMTVAEHLVKAGRPFQALSPRYAGLLGVDSLNEALREVVNPPRGQRELKIGQVVYREGDKVLNTRNDYEKKVFNGNTGIVAEIDTEKRILYILFDDMNIGDEDGLVRFSTDEALGQLTHAFCMTVHKCVHPDTLTETEEGLLPISSIDEDGIVAGPEGPRPYRNKVVNPTRPALEIETEGGYRIVVTPEHGFQGWTGQFYGRVQAADLEVGQFLRLRLGSTVEPSTPPRLPTAPEFDVRAAQYVFPTAMDARLAEWIGLMVADGTVYDKGFRLAKRHKDVVDRFYDLCVDLFGVVPTRYHKLGAYFAEVNSTFLAAWIRSVGGMNPNQKDVPECVLRSPSIIQAAFLKGLFEDGSAHLKNGRFDHVQWSTCFPSLFYKIMTMLLRQGIICGGLHRGNQWIITVSSSQLDAFKKQIGFISSFKNARLEAEASLATKYVVPVSKSEISALWSQYKTGFSSKSAYVNAMNRGVVSRRSAKLFAQSGSELMAERLGFHHARIKSIRQVQAPSMCIEVPDGHRFLQNGFDGWNSQGKEYEFVLLPIHKTFHIQLQRNLFYTAMTRAKKHFFLLGDVGAVYAAIRNDIEQARNTRLGRRIADTMGT